MPYDITLDMLPAGYSAAAARKGERASVVMREFTSSEDGDLFVSRLDGLPSDLISKLPPESKVRASSVDHLLAIIRPDKTARIYVNELSQIVKVQIKRAFEKGDAVYKDDLADIEQLDFEGVTVPDDAGVLFVMSFGWRKGLFYDLTPLHHDRPRRAYDLNRALGSYYAYMSHQDRFKITDAEWDGLLAVSWFPFSSLSTGLVSQIVNHVRAGWSTDDLLEAVHQEVAASLDAMHERWGRSRYVAPHADVVSTAVERFKAGDYISTASILYPRIEGIMRERHLHVQPGASASQRNRAGAVVEDGERPRGPFSLLLPARFRDYLDRVYFAPFTPGGPAPVSRNSVAHGVAGAADLSLKAAVIVLLTLDQICFYFPSDTPEDAPRALVEG